MDFIPNEQVPERLDVKIEVKGKYIQHFDGWNGEVYKRTVDIGLDQKDKRFFIKAFTDLLTFGISEDAKKKIDIQRQQDELLFIFNCFQGKRVEDMYHFYDSDDFKTFTQIVDVLDKLEVINPDDSLKIVIQQKTKKINPSIVLPKAEDTKALYKAISNAILRYFSENATTFELKWYLFNAYKNEVDIAAYKEMITEKRSAPIPSPTSLIGYFIDTMLPYLKSLPQFPENRHRNNSVLTEVQGKFLDRFFLLFGFYSGTYSVKTSDYKEQLSTKELRRILIAYRKERHII